MSKIPGYFERRHSRGEKSQLHPFSYNQDNKTFSIAEKRIALADFDPYEFNPYRIGLDYEGIEVSEMHKHPVLLPGFGAVIASPRLQAWAETNPEEVAETYKVMHAAFTSFFRDPSFISDERSTSHMGFASGVREHGGIGLQVWGNCACMGPGLENLYIEGQFEHGFASYELHNADAQSQRASLYAGSGHLARLASLAD